MAAVSSGVKSWLLDKYAKQVEIEGRDSAGNNALETLSSRNSGEWKQISSLQGDGSLQITLVEDKHLMLSSGTQIRSISWVFKMFICRTTSEEEVYRYKESFALVNTAQWLKTFCKGDSVLFVVRINNGFRRFRVKFANTGIKTGMDNCVDFVKTASPILPIKVIPLTDNMEASQSQFNEDSQMFTTPPSQTSQAEQNVSFKDGNSAVKEGSSLPEIARQIMSNDSAADSIQTNLPTSDLSTLIRLCLSDPGFPNFVDKVEQELRLLTTQK